MKRMISAFAAAVVSASALSAADGAPSRLSLQASADVETAYICRGFVWDTHPFSSQYVDGEFSLSPFGRIGCYTWSLLSWSQPSHADGQRYRFNEIDYGLRYAYDLEIADGWTLVSGVVKQWVTTPGREHSSAHTVVDWQVFQILRNPWVVPYWRLRYIYEPFVENYWIAGVKRAFPLFVDGLDLTLDFFGDLGDARHCEHIFGPRPGRPDSSHCGGLQSLNAVARLDYRITDHFGVFAFGGVYSIVYEPGRSSVKENHSGGVRDIAYGGAGVSLNF